MVYQSSFGLDIHLFVFAGAVQLPSVCDSEQAAARVLGYTQVSWDNASGKEKQPSSAKKHWAKLSHIERVAAVVLGYTGSMWDKGGKKYQPVSASKYWAGLTSCGEDRSVSHDLPDLPLPGVIVVVVSPE